MKFVIILAIVIIALQDVTAQDCRPADRRDMRTWAFFARTVVCPKDSCPCRNRIGNDCGHFITNLLDMRRRCEDRARHLDHCASQLGVPGSNSPMFGPQPCSVAIPGEGGQGKWGGRGGEEAGTGVYDVPWLTEKGYFIKLGQINKEYPKKMLNCLLIESGFLKNQNTIDKSSVKWLFMEDQVSRGKAQLRHMMMDPNNYNANNWIQEYDLANYAVKYGKKSLDVFDLTDFIEFVCRPCPQSKRLEFFGLSDPSESAKADTPSISGYHSF